MTVPMVRGDDTQVRGWDPMSEFNQLTERLSRLLTEEASELPIPGGHVGFTPVVDVEETDDAFLVDLELPGLKKEDIDISIANRRLVVTGERRENERKGILRRRGRSFGRFSYQIVFAEDVDEDNVEASLNDGVLALRVPKKTASEPRHIEVR
jgi:HSP20 family protein